MKKFIFIFALIAGFTKSVGAYAQKIEKGDSLGLPGDNLNLYAVLDLFQQCETFEEFEKKLNQEDSKINNLDLNNDGKTDYIKVIDNKNGDAHAVVLQVPISEKENQDVAVIEIDKDKKGNVTVQIVGNEDLYGKDYIVEPSENDPDSNKSKDNKNKPKRSDTTVSADGKTTVINNYYTTNNYNDNNNNNGVDNVVYVPVNSWPVVHYVYSPAYVVYVSPYYWYSYPYWWHPWTPWFWHDYYWHYYPYYKHHHYYYHRTDFYRAPQAHNYYQPRRTVSRTVETHRLTGTYRTTYTKPATAAKPVTSNPAFRGGNKPAGNAIPHNNANKPGGTVIPHNNPNKPAGTNKPNTNDKPGGNVNKPKDKPNYTGQPSDLPKPSNMNKPHGTKPVTYPSGGQSPKPNKPSTSKPSHVGGNSGARTHGGGGGRR